MYNCKTFTSIFLLGFLFCLPSRGQQPQRNVYEFDFIKASNPWLTSSNAAGIGTLQVDRSSFVEAYFNKEDGGLIPVEGSDNSLLAGALTESFVRISDRIAFHGKLSYSYFHGKNMGGHYLMDPSYNPVNFVESTDANPGTKTNESYDMLGGISYSFGPKWSVGANVKYGTANYAKRKDPRPIVSWMDLSLQVGTKFQPSDRFAIGLNLEYARTVERLNCKTFGTADRQYYNFIDFGGYFGYVEILDGDDGYVSTSDYRPMLNTFYGGALQLQFGNSQNVLFFNELTYKKRTGFYGEKASTNVLYCEFGGNIISYNGVLDISRLDNLHRISLYAEYAGLVNNENIYKKTTVPGENTVVEYFGQRETLSRTDIEASLSYTGYLGIEQHRPVWEYGIEADGSYKTFRATYYPYYRDQNITDIDIILHGRRNIAAGKNIFTVGVSADYFTGFGTKNSDGALASSSSSNLRTNDDYLSRDFEYDTAARVSGTLSFRYTRLFGDKIAAYIDVRDTYNHTLKKPEFLADGFRNVFTVTLGCAF